MSKQLTTLLLGLTLLVHHGNGQVFKQRFNDMVSRNDTIGQQQVLENWATSNSSDPELYVAYFNYYVGMSKKELVTLGHVPKGNNGLEVKNIDSANRSRVAYLYGDMYVDTTMLNIGFDWIRKGIEKHPNRLDMRFGMIYMLGQIKDYNHFTSEIIRTIDHSSVIRNMWIWADGKPLDHPNEFMLESIQAYQLQLYKTEDDSLLENMRRIAESVLRYYPNHVESLSDLSIVLMLQEQYDKALVPLLKAEKIAPKDYVVLSNIAHAYKLTGDKINALKYYKRTLKYGDDQAKRYAQEQIDELTPSR